MDRQYNMKEHTITLSMEEIRYVRWATQVAANALTLAKKRDAGTKRRLKIAQRAVQRMYAATNPDRDYHPNPAGFNQHKETEA